MKREVATGLLVSFVWAAGYNAGRVGSPVHQPERDEAAIMAKEDPAIYPAEDDAAARCRDMDQPQRRPLQFSLRTMFIAMTVLSVVFAGLFAGPIWAALVTAYCLLLAISITLTVVAIYGSGYRRTFCIGAMFPVGTLLLFGGQSSLLTVSLQFGGFGDGDRLVVGIAVGIVTVAILASGLLAVGVRRLVEAGQDSQPRHATEREED